MKWWRLKIDERSLALARAAALKEERVAFREGLAGLRLLVGDQVLALRRTDNESTDSGRSVEGERLFAGPKEAAAPFCGRLILDQLHALLVDRLLGIFGGGEHLGETESFRFSAQFETKKGVEAGDCGILLAGSQSQLAPRGEEAEELVLVTLAQAVGKRVVRIFGPGDPCLVDFEIFEMTVLPTSRCR